MTIEKRIASKVNGRGYNGARSRASQIASAREALDAAQTPARPVMVTGPHDDGRIKLIATTMDAHMLAVNFTRTEAAEFARHLIEALVK